MKTCKFYYPNSNSKDQIFVFVVESNDKLTIQNKRRLLWILDPNIQNENKTESEYPIYLPPDGKVIKYIGPNLRFETPESEKLRAICLSFGLEVIQIEKFIGHICDLDEEIHFDKMTEAVYEELPNSLLIHMDPEPVKIIDLINTLDEFAIANKNLGMGMDQFDMDYYYNLFVNLYKRNPTDVELSQIAQGNSSHSRHWEFFGKFIINGKEMEKTLIQMVKETLAKNPTGSIKAFNDNGGVLKGGRVKMFIPDSDGIYQTIFDDMHHTATAETHNHPTLISPYPGALTATGGKLRDIMDLGRGSFIGFGGVYFQTGKLWLNKEILWNYPKNKANPLEVLIGAILGTSGYGNPFGEPTIMFEHDSLGFVLPNSERFESVKPIIYACAVGSIPDSSVIKPEAKPGMLIIRIGGATMRVGVGGGAASSMNAGSNDALLDFSSVQRGEPMIGRSAYNVIEHCVFMGEENPIEAIHDQGAGGASNVITELTNPCGGVIDIRKMRIVDPSLSVREAWIAESQELHGILLKPGNLDLFKAICARYECKVEILGETNDSKKIVVKDSNDGSTSVDLTLLEILGELPQKTYTDKTLELKFNQFIMPSETIDEIFKKIARVPGVAFIDYMVDHFDGSVGGRIVQGPRVGEFQLPICKYAIMSDGFSGITGCVSTITRTNPVAMLIDEASASRMAVAEMLTTLAFTHIPGGTSRIKGRLNVMWPFKNPGMKAKLYSGYTAMTDALKVVGIGIDGGKDSSSMSTSFDNETAVSFPTFVLEPYAHVSDFRTRVTPDLKGGSTELILIEPKPVLDKRLGGSAFFEAYGETGNEVPDVDLKKVSTLFKLIQYLVRKNKIVSGSPKLKGGLLPTIAKMACASNHEASVDLFPGFDPATFYFNEEIGVVVECDIKESESVLNLTKRYGLIAHRVGRVKSNNLYLQFYDNQNTYNPFKMDVRKWFKELGKDIKFHLGIDPKLLESSFDSKQKYKLTFNPDEPKKIDKSKKKVFLVAVLAAPGTNGHHELAYMFGRMKGKFKVITVQMSELLSGECDLNDFNVIAFAGGFSYGDVAGSGKGWAASILFNPRLKKMFDDFFARPDTLSFGVCNGFQVATLLGILDESLGQKPRLMHNDSGIFEHRPVNLLIPDNTKSIMFQDMQGSILPAWSAHGEGKLFLPDGDYSLAESLGLVSVQYVDTNGHKTDQYPLNPNGSPNGIAGLCTKDGRHTFMMPHIERVSASNHHLPYKPKDWNFKTPVWSKAFENMYLWLLENAK